LNYVKSCCSRVANWESGCDRLGFNLFSYASGFDDDLGTGVR